VATILDTYMTLIKKKITEIESIVNKADNRKTAGKIYLPKDWIGKKVKTVLITSLIAMVIVVITQQDVKALTNEEILKKKHDYFNNVLWPGFQKDCRYELSIYGKHIAENQLLTGDDMMNCKIAQNDWIGRTIPDLSLIDMGKVDAIKLYILAVVENNPLP
jgi:putative transposon-encoded protein